MKKEIALTELNKFFPSAPATPLPAGTKIEQLESGKWRFELPSGTSGSGFDSRQKCENKARHLHRLRVDLAL